MTSRLSQDPANLAPFVVTPRANTQARRVQSANTTGSRPSTTEREIGNETVVGVTFDPPEVTMSIEANLVNARLLSLFANRDPATTFSLQTMQDMLGSSDVDLLMVQRNAARTAWIQSIYVRQGTVSSYSISASTDASATETFELAADNKTAFERFVKVDNLTAVGSAQAGYTLTGTPVPLTRGQLSGNKLISAAYAQANGASTYLLENTDYTVAGTAVTITNTTALAAIINGTQFLFAYQVSGSTTPDPFQAKDTTSPAAIRGYYFIPVTIAANNSAGTSVRGMQSVEATVNFNSIKEVGMGNQAVGSFRETPAEVTGNFVIFEEDYSIEKLMIAGTTSSTDTDYPIESFRSDIVITMQFKHPDTLVTLRTDILSGLTISSDGKDVAVGDQVGKQFEFTAATNFSWYVTKNV